MEAIRIMMVDDHQIVREGLGRMLELEPDMRVVAEASDSEEAIRQVRAVEPDVILMDIQMPGMNGVELTRRLTKELPELKILVLTMHEEYLPEAIAAGAVGYLRKDLGRWELAQAIRTASGNKFVLNTESDRLFEVPRTHSNPEVLSEWLPQQLLLRPL